MATVYRHQSAGENDEIGIDGSHAEHRWVVEFTTSEDAEDPVGQIIPVVPVGAPHPIQARFPGVICRGYVIEKRVNERSWYVIVRYGPLTDEVVGLWVRSGNFAVETFELERSLAVLADDGEVEDAREPWMVSHAIGDPDFRLQIHPPLEGAEAATHYAEPGHIGLVATGRLKPERLTINRGVRALQYSITVPQLSARTVASVDDLAWHCNNGVMLGAYGRWELIFSNWRFDDFVMSVPSARSVGWYTRVTVEILRKKIHPIHDPFGWRGVQRQVKWPNERGYALQVTTLAGAPIYNNWATYEETLFDNIFTRIGGHVPSQ